jgi:hypothetical protein
MSVFDFLRPEVDVQLNMPPEKPRDVDSEIDWKIIDQLHNAVLNFSRNSMQAKKIMFTLLGIFMAAMIQAPILVTIVRWFPVIIGIVVLFWAFDSYTYFYQEKLRAAMDVRFESLKKRYPSNSEDEFTLPEKRQKKGRFWRSIFNGSVLFYPIIIVIEGDGGQVPVPSFIFSKLHKNAPISTEKGASCIKKQRFAIAA